MDFFNSQGIASSNPDKQKQLRSLKPRNAAGKPGLTVIVGRSYEVDTNYLDLVGQDYDSDDLAEYGITGLHDDKFDEVNEFLKDEPAAEELLAAPAAPVASLELDVCVEKPSQMSFEDESQELQLAEKKYQDGVYVKLGRPMPSWTDALFASAARAAVKKVVPEILAGRRSSGYVKKALAVAELSSKQSLGSREFGLLDWTEFSLGYFGLKRQQAVSKQIAKQFPKYSIADAAVKKAADFWGRDLFTLYVMSPEVAANLAAQDFAVSSNAAYEILKDTTDYGRFFVDRKQPKAAKRSFLDTLVSDEELAPASKKAHKMSSGIHSDLDLDTL